MEKLRRPRTHGCSVSPHPYQVASWICAATLVIGFYVLVLPLLPFSLCVSAGVLYTVVFLVALWLAAVTTFSDPTDPVVLEERRAKVLEIPFDVSPYTQVCTICKTHVQTHSKHCGQCDRCVSGFDHHCKWLNNCIGQQNYSYFFALVAAADIQMALQTAFTAYALDGLIGGELLHRLKEVYEVEGKQARVYAVVVCALEGAAAMCLLALLQLVLLHIWLRSKGLTTYEYIMRCRRKSRKLQPSLDQSVNMQDKSASLDITDGSRPLIYAALAKHLGRRKRDSMLPPVTKDPDNCEDRGDKSVRTAPSSIHPVDHVTEAA